MNYWQYSGFDGTVYDYLGGYKDLQVGDSCLSATPRVGSRKIIPENPALLSILFQAVVAPVQPRGGHSASHSKKSRRTR